MAKQSAELLSLLEEDATDGGGIDGALATVKEIEFVEKFKYASGQMGGCALRVKYLIEGFDKPWEQHFGIGKTENFDVVDDGDAIKPLGKARGLNKKTAGFLFFSNLKKAIVGAGYSVNSFLGEGVNIAPMRQQFESGLKVRLGAAPYTDMGGKTKDLAVIVGFEGKFSSPNGKENGASTTSKAASHDDSQDAVETKTEAAITTLLEDGPVKFADLGTAILKAHRQEDDVRAMVQLAQREKWIADDERPWTYNSKKRTLAEAN